MLDKIKLYKPVIIIYLISFLAAYAISYGFENKSLYLMHYFMGIFLLIFSLLKLFDITAFANDFAKYDLIAGKVNIYGKIYPFIELGLALAYLVVIKDNNLYIFTIIIMSLSSLGIIISLRKNQQISCACVGKFFDLPLGKVSIFENVTMIAMAILLLK